MQTVISAFKDSDTAQRALNRLVQAGFARQDVHIQEPPAGEPGTGLPPEASRQLMGSAEREVAASPGGLASYGRFFASLFGLDEPARGHARVYSQAVQAGHSVVVVDATDEEQASRAVELMHDLGAIDVHQNAQGQGWDAAGDTPHRMDRGGVRVFPRASSRPLREELQEAAPH